MEDIFSSHLDEAKDSLMKKPILTELLDELEALQAEEERLLAELNAVKEKRRAISHERLPALFTENGVIKVGLPGREARLETEIAATVKNMPAFVRYLAKRGDDTIVKTRIELGKMSSEEVERVYKAVAEVTEYIPEVEQTIHKATLEKWVRDVTGLRGGKAAVPLAKLPPSISVFVIPKVVVKRKNHDPE